MSATKSSPRDFSLFSLFTAGLACLVPFANAYTQPVGASPKGNPISEPGLNSVVPAGENYTVTWQPTTEGTVTLVLLKGPSTNAVPQYAIAEKINNTGSFVWMPSTDLAPQDVGYGIQLIVDSDGQYQYSTQFGISNPDYKQQSSSTSASSAAGSTTLSKSATASAIASTSTKGSATATANTTTSSLAYVTDVVTTFTTYCPEATQFTMANHTYTVSSATSLTITITKPVSYATAGPISGTGAPSSGYPAYNSSILTVTGSMTVPASLRTTASLTLAGISSKAASATGSSIAPVQTGAGANIATSFAGLVVAAGVAVFAL